MNFVRLYRIFLLHVLVVIFISCTAAPRYTSKADKRQSKALHKTPKPTNSAKQDDVMPSNDPEGNYKKGMVLKGWVSYYGPGFHGRLTANGEVYDQNKLTCAHKHLPFNTKLKVTLLKTGKSVIVRVNDRGPYSKGRIIDLSVEAARRIGMLKMGTGEVKAEIIQLGDK